MTFEHSTVSIDTVLAGRPTRTKTQIVVHIKAIQEGSLAAKQRNIYAGLRLVEIKTAEAIRTRSAGTVHTLTITQLSSRGDRTLVSDMKKLMHTRPLTLVFTNLPPDSATRDMAANEECREGWAGENCDQCAAGWGGELCTLKLSSDSERRKQMRVESDTEGKLTRQVPQAAPRVAIKTTGVPRVHSSEECSV